MARATKPHKPRKPIKPGGVPTRLDQRMWAALWIVEGGDPHKAWEASAVVMAESGGKISIYNGICCYGGYQFNTNTLDKECAVNPICATRAAIKHSNNGQDWSIWEAHTNGSYQQYMRQTASFNLGNLVEEAAKMVSPLYRLFKEGKPVPKIPGAEGIGKHIPGLGQAEDALSSLTAPVTDIAAFFVGFGELVLTPEGWLRLAKILGGSIFILWGLRIVVRESTGSDPVKGATKAAEAAATIAAVK